MSSGKQRGRDDANDKGAKRKKTSDEEDTIASLEAQLVAEKAARAHDAAKLEFLADKVRSVAERSKSRGVMLVKLLSAMKKCEQAKAGLEQAKGEVAAADAELDAVFAQATAAMAEEEQGGSRQPATPAPATTPAPAGTPGQTSTGGAEGPTPGTGGAGGGADTGAGGGGGGGAPPGPPGTAVQGSQKLQQGEAASGMAAGQKSAGKGQSGGAGREPGEGKPGRMPIVFKVGMD